MHVAAGDEPDLPVCFYHSLQPCRRLQGDGVHARNTAGEGRVMQENQGRRRWKACEFQLQPAEPCRAQSALLTALVQGVEEYQVVAEKLDGVLQVAAIDREAGLVPKHRQHRGAPVVISGHQKIWLIKAAKQLLQISIFLDAAAIHEVAAQDNRIGRRTEGLQAVEGAVEAYGRVQALPKPPARRPQM